MHPRCSWILVFAAFGFLGIAVSVDGHDPFDPVDLGYEALDKSDWDTALARFNEAIHAQPKNARAYQGRGIAHGKKSDFDPAIADLTKAIELDPTETTAYLARGGFYLYKGDYDHAIADCNEAIRRDPNDAIAYSNRGGAYYYKGNVERAIADFSKAIRLDSEFADAYSNRGYAYYCQGHLDEAIRDLTEAIRLDSKTASTYRKRGGAYFERRMLDRAIADFEEAIRLDPHDSAAFCMRAVTYYYKGEFDKALAGLDEAIRLAPTEAELYLKRAMFFAVKGEVNRAAADYDEAVRVGSRNAETYFRRGMWLAEQHESDRAMADLNEAIKLDPKAPCAFEARGALWITRGDYERGMADIRMAQWLNPADPKSAFEAWPKHAPNREALEHGKRQLEQMLHDRPAMAKHGERAQVLYEWAARKFAGEDLGQKIFWDASEPPPHASAFSSQPSPEKPGFIRVRKAYSDGPSKGKERSFEELWHDAVFELYNVNNVANDLERLTMAAIAGTLSKEEFVAKIIEHESHTVDSTSAFYIHVFLPWAKERRVHTDPYQWYLGMRACPNESFQMHVVEKSPYWQDYAHRYDLITLACLVQKGKYHEAIDLAAEISSKAETPSERAAIFNCTGFCFVQLNKPDQAITAYSECIRWDAKDYDARLGRAKVYLQLHDTDRAMADCCEAIRLDPSNNHAIELRTAIEQEKTYLARVKVLRDARNCSAKTKKKSAEKTDASEAWSDKKRNGSSERSSAVAP